MEYKEWTTIDKSSWPRGEWDKEPDKVQWADAATGLPCLVVREPHGALCGYVGVAEGHPLFRVSYHDADALVGGAHGGLTFSAFFYDGICDIDDFGESAQVWWLGFDCGHYMDYVPGASIPRRDGIYRDIGYVQRCCEKLATSIKAAERDGEGGK